MVPIIIFFVEYAIFGLKFWELLVYILIAIRWEWSRAGGQRREPPWKDFIEEIELRGMDGLWIYICISLNICFLLGLEAVGDKKEGPGISAFGDQMKVTMVDRL